jgi:hypothetical protein
MGVWGVEEGGFMASGERGVEKMWNWGKEKKSAR